MCLEIMPKQKQKDDTIVSTRDDRWMPPKDWVPLSSEEYLAQQKWIRDRANEELASKLERGKFKGVMALQRMALDAAAEVDRIESRVRVDTLSDTLSWSVFTDSDGDPVDITYDDGGAKADA